MEFWNLVAARYADKPDDFTISLGDQRVPFPDKQLSMTNLPEIVAVISIQLGDVRRWVKVEGTPAAKPDARLVHNSDVHGPRGLTPRSLAGFFRTLNHRRELYDIVPEGSHNVLTTAIVDDQRQRVVMTYTATKEAGEHA